MSSRRLGIALALVASLAAVTAWALAPGDPIARAEAASRRGDWGTVVSQVARQLKGAPDDPRARRLHARGLAHLGRDAESLADYRALGAERLAVDDYLLLGDSLARGGRDALAWLAIDAGERIAPGDARVRSAMTRMHGLVGRRSGVAHVTERLAAVPGGPALGELVLELSVLAKAADAGDPVLDRVLSRDRAVLRALDGPVAVRRLLARVLLEVGRPEEARVRLISILRDGADPEASWLLSRAWLQLGKDDEASAALVRALAFGRDRPHEPEPARYIGAKACRECHSSIYKDQQSNRHATSLHHGADMARIPLPPGPVADPVEPGVTHTFTREGDKVRVETTAEGRRYRALMDFALGSGHRGMTMVGKDEAGDRRELRLSLYAEHGPAWDVTSGFSAHPKDPSEFLGRALSPGNFRDCVHCHATRFRSEGEWTGPESRDRGIGCERCHGPGGNHVAAVKSGLADLAIGRFKDATAAQKMTACSGCHASDGTFPPSDPQFVRFQSTTLPFSKCFTASGGKLDCTTCHDPHKSVETSSAYYEKKCLDCHATAGTGSAGSSRHVSCPVNPKTDCLKCHMPRMEEVVPHTSFTDHHIRVHRQEDPR